MLILRVVFLLCVWISISESQTYKWTSFTTDNTPLPSNNLLSLFVDNNDILWIGSDSGLTGYNGSAWINYHPFNSEFTGQPITSVLVNGNEIQLGTFNGLVSGQINDLDMIQWEAQYNTQNSALIYNKIIALNRDSLGSYWVCTDSGITIIADTSWISFSAAEPLLSRNKILCINRQPTYMQYVGSESGGVSRLYKDVDGISGASTIWKQWTSFPDSTGRIRGLLSDTVTAILVDRNGDRWYGTNQGLSFHSGMFLKNPYSWEIYTTETGLVDNRIQTLAEDNAGAIWIGTEGGLSRVLEADTELANFTTDNGLVSNNIRDIAVTSDDIIWLATDAGLSQLSITPTSITQGEAVPQPSSFEIYPAYPNPFNIMTTIKFQLYSAEHIKITIFDISGKKVKTILNAMFMPGIYNISWNGKNGKGKDIVSGVYFAAVTVSGQASLLKLVLIK